MASALPMPSGPASAWSAPRLRATLALRWWLRSRSHFLDFSGLLYRNEESASGMILRHRYAAL